MIFLLPSPSHTPTLFTATPIAAPAMATACGRLFDFIASSCLPCTPQATIHSLLALDAV